MLRKLSSRKLWMAIAGVAMGVFMALGGDASDVEAVAGAVTALVCAVSYICTEGWVDAERVKGAIEAVQMAAKRLDEEEDER